MLLRLSAAISLAIPWFAAAMLGVLLAPGASARQEPPGPGLGDSLAHPSGRPVDLKLPPGYGLMLIRGSVAEDYYLSCLEFNHRDPSPRCRYVRGFFELTLVLAFDPRAAAPGPSSTHGFCTEAPAWGGWVLVSEDSSAQNVVVPVELCTTADGSVTPVLDLPSRTTAGTVELSIGGYCLNLARSIPDESHRFLAGVATDDPGLGLVVGAIVAKDLYESSSQSTVQDIIWDYTDFGEGPELRLGELAALP